MFKSQRKPNLREGTFFNRGGTLMMALKGNRAIVVSSGHVLYDVRDYDVTEVYGRSGDVPSRFPYTKTWLKVFQQDKRRM